MLKQGCKNPRCVSTLCSNHYLPEDCELTSIGMDKNEAFKKGLSLATILQFKIEDEKCSARPIYGEEIGIIFRVLNEEQKEPSWEEIIVWLKEVYSDPFALACSFYPSHLKPERWKDDF